jgi:hypothetical protein
MTCRSYKLLETFVAQVTECGTIYNIRNYALDKQTCCCIDVAVITGSESDGIRFLLFVLDSFKM